MDATKLTRQGVRDLDFGWKKKPVAAPAQDGTAAESDAQAKAVKDAAEIPAESGGGHPAHPAAADVPAS